MAAPAAPISDAASRRIASDLIHWFAAHARDLPWRRTRDPYAIWVSEIMLQQTQVKTVIPYWERWLRELPTIAAAAEVAPAKLHKLWEGLGYYSRVRNLQRAAQEIVQKHGGRFPEEFEAILALPGIGRYTAGAISSIAFNRPRPILDGNVIRVLTRLFGIRTDPREKTTNARLWRLAEQLVNSAAQFKKPADSCSHLNQSLMELGALVCTPRNPHCQTCPLRARCVAFREGQQEDWPNLGKRTAALTRHCVAWIVERDGKFLVRQRPTGVVNAELWEFPNTESLTAPSSADLRALLPKGFAPTQSSPFCTVKHSITRYRITLQAWRGQLPYAPSRSDSERWFTLPYLQKLAFTSAHKKILERLLKTR